ncbi:MAG: phage major capsid domain-containing protein, partial [Candidatus Fonsibacter sp.]
MTETLEKILVKDDRLGCIAPKVKLQAFKGGQNITRQNYMAISETPANHVYTVTVPSLETNICRAGCGNRPSHFGYPTQTRRRLILLSMT